MRKVQAFNKSTSSNVDAWRKMMHMSTNPGAPLGYHSICLDTTNLIISHKRARRIV